MFSLLARVYEKLYGKDSKMETGEEALGIQPRGVHLKHTTELIAMDYDLPCSRCGMTGYVKFPATYESWVIEKRFLWFRWKSKQFGKVEYHKDKAICSMCLLTR